MGMKEWEDGWKEGRKEGGVRVKKEGRMGWVMAGIPR